MEDKSSLPLGKKKFEEEQERWDSLSEEERQKEIDEHYKSEGLRQLN